MEMLIRYFSRAGQVRMDRWFRRCCEFEFSRKERKVMHQLLCGYFALLGDLCEELTNSNGRKDVISSYTFTQSLDIHNSFLYRRFDW